MVVEIRGKNLPGRRFERFVDVRVGLRIGGEIAGLVAAGAEEACWETDIRVRQHGDAWEFGGSAVRGPKGERSLGLAWVDRGGELFRAAKLRLDKIPPAIVAAASESDGRLVAVIDLTDEKGGPVCATIPDSHVAWQHTR